MSGLLSPATFEPHIGTEFAIDVGDETIVDAVLDGVRRQAPRSHGDRTEPFALTFVCARDTSLAQATYSMQHPVLGTVDIFLVPIGPDDSGRPRYEAVFN